MSYSSGNRLLIGEAASWIAAAGILILGFVYFDDLRSATGRMLGAAQVREASGPEGEQAADGARTSGDGEVEIRAGESGHYHAEAEVNGRPVSVLVDTGATMVALTYEDAEQAGIFLKPSDFTRQVSTANGIARVAPVTLDRVSIGPITVRDVPGTVSERGNLRTTLLGMSFLSRLEHVDMRGGVLVLKE